MIGVRSSTLITNFPVNEKPLESTVKSKDDLFLGSVTAKNLFGRNNIGMLDRCNSCRRYMIGQRIDQDENTAKDKKEQTKTSFDGYIQIDILLHNI